MQTTKKHRKIEIRTRSRKMPEYVFSGEITQDGRPLPGIKVELYGQEPDQPWSLKEPTETDDAGTYRFTVHAGARYKLHIQDDTRSYERRYVISTANHDKNGLDFEALPLGSHPYRDPDDEDDPTDAAFMYDLFAACCHLVDQHDQKSWINRFGIQSTRRRLKKLISEYLHKRTDMQQPVHVLNDLCSTCRADYYSGPWAGNYQHLRNCLSEPCQQ